MFQTRLYGWASSTGWVIENLGGTSWIGCLAAILTLSAHHRPDLAVWNGRRSLMLSMPRPGGLRASPRTWQVLRAARCRRGEMPFAIFPPAQTRVSPTCGVTWIWASLLGTILSAQV